MGRITTIWDYMVRHKYIVVSAIALLLIGIVDEHSFRKYAMLTVRENEVREELRQAEENFARDSTRLQLLKANHQGVERIARERYFMKRPNEEIFVLSTDREATKAVENQE